MGTIRIVGLGKAFKLYRNSWTRLADWWLPKRHPPRYKLHWVLRDIHLNIRQGETIGLVGVNGAGKSTLLKLLTGTTQPTKGHIEIGGRVAALLELGMGFHPDFTGRQNVYTAGQLLGLQPSQIADLMSHIVAFAEIGHYIDEPVRVYSSGMQMRLAFSVATALRPDVLIVDEALSVGDAHFQHKSFERIRQFREQGTTILLVSHDKAVIQSICDRAVLLHEGDIAMQGPPDVVMDYYNALLADLDAAQIEQIEQAGGHVQTVSGTQQVRLSQLSLRDANDRPIEVVQVGQPLSLVAQVQVVQPVDTLVFGYLIKDRLGQAVFGTNTQHMGQPLCSLCAGEQVTYRFNFVANLGTGNYSISTAQVGGQDHINANYEWRDRALLFSVVNADHPPFEGVNWLPPQLTTERV